MASNTSCILLLRLDYLEVDDDDDDDLINYDDDEDDDVDGVDDVVVDDDDDNLFSYRWHQTYLAFYSYFCILQS